VEKLERPAVFLDLRQTAPRPLRVDRRERCQFALQDSHGAAPRPFAGSSDRGYAALGRAHEAGINLTYGTDLLGGMHRYQAKEFAIRGKVIRAIEVIRSATVTAAALLQREGELGVIAPGAAGDFIITKEDPLNDLDILAESRLDFVIQQGDIVSSTSTER
jgi:imidazolonepropionase-like amidohydrolase